MNYCIPSTAALKVYCLVHCEIDFPCAMIRDPKIDGWQAVCKYANFPV